MAKGHELLEKKVDKLESKLKDIFSNPVESPHLQLIASEVIKGRFAFLKNLLSAEIQSQTTEPDHLHNIAQKLKELESLFKYWDTYRTLSESPMNDNKVDTASTGSSPESCLNNDEVSVEDLGGGGGGGGRDLDGYVHEDRGIVLEYVVQEQKTVETVKDKGCKEKEREERRVWLSGNKVCAVMCGVMILIVAVGVVMTSFCGSCCYGSEVEGFLTPT